MCSTFGIQILPLMKSRTRLIFFVIVFGHLVTEVVAEIPGIPVVHRL